MNSAKLFNLFFFLIGISVITAACSDLSTQTIPENTELPEPLNFVATPEYPIVLEAIPGQNNWVWGDLSTQNDQQGAVTVDITTVNLNDLGDKLYFEISLNTHSVDLSMDLASLTILTTDNGLSIEGNYWDAEVGGHHLSGALSFLLEETDIELLEGASQLTLIIRDLDAPERIFNWQK